MGGVCYGVFFILTEQMLSLSIERSWVNSSFGWIDSEPIWAQGIIVKYSLCAGPTLVKIFQGSLKILEDPRRSAWRSYSRSLRIFIHNPQRSSKFLPRSSRFLQRLSRFLEVLCMYLEGLCWNLKDLCKILKDLGLLDLCILGSHGLTWFNYCSAVLQGCTRGWRTSKTR